MILWDFLRAAIRWWFVVLIGVTFTAVGALFVSRAEGIHFARMEVVLLVPSSMADNVLQYSPEGLMTAASAITIGIDGSAQPLKFGDPSVSLAGITDQREATWIRVEDQGSQWVTDIRSPIILVDVVARTPERVRELQYAMIAQIGNELQSLETQWGVAREDRIQLKVAPEATAIHLIQGDKIRSLGMTILLGSIAILAALWSLERWRSRSMESHSQTGNRECSLHGHKVGRHEQEAHLSPRRRHQRKTD